MLEAPKQNIFDDMKFEYNEPFGDLSFVPKEKKSRTSKRAPPELNYEDDDVPGEAADYTFKKLVSSKLARDIVRSSNFMPGQFDEWNRNPKGGNNNYTSENKDIDGDKIPEFLVKKGDKIIAVNGYTTKKSDFPFKREYYERYPSAKLRKNHKYSDFIKDDYYGPTYSADGSSITKWSGTDPTTDEFKRKYKNFNTHRPRPLSTYQAFSKYIVGPACKLAFMVLGKSNPEKAKIARKVAATEIGKPMIESYITSITYAIAVKVPTLSELDRNHQLEEYQDAFLAHMAIKDPSFKLDFKQQDVEKSLEYKKFEDWLFGLENIKNRVREHMKKLLSDDREKYVYVIRDYIVSKLKAIDNFDDKVEYAWGEKLNELDDKYNLNLNQE